MPKNNQKCLRLSDDVLKIVEAYRGDGFNEKFENMVLDIHKRKNRVVELDKAIEARNKELSKLREQINKAEQVKLALDRFLKSIA